MLAYSQFGHVNHYKPCLFPNIVRWSKTIKLLKLTNSYTEYEQSRITKMRFLTKKMQMPMGTLQKMTFCFLFLKYRTPIR